MNPFQPTGKTISFTADTTAPTAVQVIPLDGQQANQLMLTNVSTTVTAFIVFSGVSSADAVSKATVPSGTAQLPFPLLPNSQVVVTYTSGNYITGVTASSTAAIYCTPGIGF